MENKKRLSSEIISNIKSKQKISHIEIMINGRENVYEYFLRENIRKIFGKTEFDEDELELVTTKDGIEISSIFGTTLNIMVEDAEIGTRIYGLIDGEKVFSINSLYHTITNMCKTINDGLVSQTNYSVDIDNTEYSYFEGICPEENSFEYSYGATLKPMNAKYRDIEIFELTREIPKEEKSQSLLKRIVDNIRGNGYVKIETSNELVDVVDYSEVVFDRLKEEANKFSKENSNVVKKELKNDSNN